MSQFNKLLLRIRSLDKNLRFEELQKVLERCGYRMDGPNSGGSHKTFRKTGKVPVTIPINHPIKIDYVKKVRDAIENEKTRK